MTPGAYLKHRRTAAGLSLVDVARELLTEPRIAEHLRAEWIERIEADVVPATFNTIAALRCAFPFDLAVLERLALIAMGANLAPPRICRICGCSEFDPCVEFISQDACAWIEQDLCSAHAPGGQGA